MAQNALENQTLRELHARKSVRVYDESRLVETGVKQELFQAALAAPTAGGMCLYTILDITDEARKKRLATLCDNQAFIAKAPVVLVFLADWERWYDSFVAVGGADVRTPAEGDLLLAASDAIIAAQNVVVAAEAMGLGSCYIGDVLENGEEIAEMLSIPRFAMPVCMLCIGYPTQQQVARTKPKRFGVEYLVHENAYHRAERPALERMFDEQEAKQHAFEATVGAMEKRKWSSPFMAEMNHSVRIWLKRWTEGE